MIQIDQYIDALFHPSIDNDTVLYIVVTYYDKNGKPFVSFPWRGFAETFTIPDLLSDVAKIGLVFAPNKPRMFSLFERKKAHPLPFGSECVIELLELVKERMKVYGNEESPS